MPKICLLYHQPIWSMSLSWSWAQNLFKLFARTVSKRFLQELTLLFLVKAGPGLSFAASVDLGVQVVWSIVFQDSENIPIVAQAAMSLLEKLNLITLDVTWQLSSSLCSWSLLSLLQSC